MKTAPQLSMRRKISWKRSRAMRPAAWVRASARLGARHLAERGSGAERRAGDPRRDGRALLRATEDLADVVVGKEAVRVLAGQDHGTDPVVLLGTRDQVVQCVDEGLVEERVRRVRERREEDPPVLIDLDRPAHRPSRLIVKPAIRAAAIRIAAARKPSALIGLVHHGSALTGRHDRAGRSGRHR